VIVLPETDFKLEHNVDLLAGVIVDISYPVQLVLIVTQPVPIKTQFDYFD
jgi:hypothetical protein